MDVFKRERIKWAIFPGLLLFAQLALLAAIQLQFGTARWAGIAANVGDASEYLLRPGNFSSIPIFTYHMPFYSLLIAFATLILPPVQAAILVNMVSYLGFGSVVYLLSRRMWIGVVASLFPYFVFKYVVYVYADIPAFLFAGLSFYLLAKNRVDWALLFGTLAVATHYLALLLIPSFLYCMYRKRPRFTALGLVPSLPFVVFSIFRLLENNDLFFYLRLNVVQWGQGGAGYGIRYGFLSYPFASVIYVVTHLSTLMGSSLPVNIYYALIIFLPVYPLYWLGAYAAYRASAYLELAWGLPVLLFVSFLSPVGFAYVPRYVIFAFPFLMRIAAKAERRRYLQILTILIIIGNIIYTFGSVLIVPFA